MSDCYQRLVNKVSHGNVCVIFSVFSESQHIPGLNDWMHGDCLQRKNLGNVEKPTAHECISGPDLAISTQQAFTTTGKTNSFLSMAVGHISTDNRGSESSILMHHYFN